MPQTEASRVYFDPEGPAIHLRSIGVRLGARSASVAEAVVDGQYRADHAERDGYTAVRVSDETVPQAASAIARATAAAGGVEGGDLGCVTFSGVHAHGHRAFWQPAAALQRVLGAERALAWSLHHGCNAHVLAMIQGAAMLRSVGGHSLHVAADRFSGTRFDRWRSDTGLVYGDAAVAVCLSRHGGFARIVHMDVESLPDLETMHRMPEPVHDVEDHWNISETKRLHLAEAGREGFVERIRAAADALRARLPMPSAGSELYDGVVTPFVGDPIARAAYGAVFHPLGRRTAEAHGRTVGHTGAGDQIVGLHHLLSTGETKAGQRYLMVGAGAGFSIGVVLIELTGPVQARGEAICRLDAAGT